MGAAIQIKFYPPFPITFIGSLEKRSSLLEEADVNPLLWLWYLGHIFRLRAHALGKFKKILDILIFLRIRGFCFDLDELNNLNYPLMNRGYKQEAINRRIHQINAIGRESLLVKYSKQNKIEILVLELISYPALEIVHEILL